MSLPFVKAVHALESILENFDNQFLLFNSIICSFFTAAELTCFEHAFLLYTNESSAQTTVKLEMKFMPAPITRWPQTINNDNQTVLKSYMFDVLEGLGLTP